MPDELPLRSLDLEEAIALMNAAIERANRAELRTTELAAKLAVAELQLYQCRVDRDFPDLGTD